MYFKEREGFETIESEAAILSYKITGENCYIRDVYVLPEYRKSGEGSILTDQLAAMAKEAGCTHLTGTVVPSTNGSTLSMMAMIKYGFKLAKSHEDFIVLTKEI